MEVEPNLWDIEITSPGVYEINWDVGIDSDRPSIRTLSITQPLNRNDKLDVYIQAINGRFE